MLTVKSIKILFFMYVHCTSETSREIHDLSYKNNINCKIHQDIIIYVCTLYNVYLTLTIGSKTDENESLPIIHKKMWKCT